MARERYEIRDKVILITGPARGIGAEAARQLAARGARLSLVGLEPELLEQRARELGPNAVWFEADVTDVEALNDAVARTLEHFGELDVVIANAGIAPFGTVATIDPAEFERVIEVNLLGVWRTVRATLPHVVARRGYVLAIASDSAAVHVPLLSGYAASKAGVEAFANSLRGEIAYTGTRVGVAYFHFMDTDLVREGFKQESARVLHESAGPLSHIAPVSTAGRAIVRGIERRANKVYSPRWILPLLYARGMLGPLLERRHKDPTVVEAIRMAESEQGASGNGTQAAGKASATRPS